MKHGAILTQSRMIKSNSEGESVQYFKLGAKIKLCTTDQAEREGVCCRHGAKSKMLSSEGCTNLVV
eukprot:scaffold21715_cov114-Skeletonema_marinoi.AAC.4